MENQIDKLVNDPFTAETDEITALLNEELSKPAHKLDYEKINELTEAYTALIGIEDEIAARSASGIEALETKVQMNKPHIHVTKRFKALMTAGIAAAILLTANTISVAAFQKDVFSLIVDYAESSFSIRFREYPEGHLVELPTTPEDPYGIKAECAKYGMEVLAPTYLPEGFELYDCKYHTDDMIGYHRVDFWFYRNRKEVVQLVYTFLPQNENGSGIPSDDFNLKEIEIQGIPIIVSEEDGQSTAIFYQDNLETIISTDSGYEEANKIITSIQ